MAMINNPNKPDYTGTSSQEYINKYTNRPEDAGNMQGIQDLLSKIGMAPGVGEPADLLNSLLYAMQGQGKEAGLSALSMLPFLGGIIKPIKKAKIQEQKLFKDKIRKKYFAEQAAETKKLEDDYFDKELNWQDIDMDSRYAQKEPKSLIKSLFESLEGKEF